MATETLIFMPNGDVTLKLIRYVFKEDDIPSQTSSELPNGPRLEQTMIDEHGLPPASSIDEEPAGAEEESVLFFAPDPPENPNGPSSPPPPRAARGSNASSRRERSESPPASFWATLKRQAARVTEPAEDEQTETPPAAKKPERVVLSSHEVQCLVSSRHIMLASRHFQRILSGDFNEAITFRTTGHVTIQLQDDLDTMIILLNIIHGAGRKVPRQVSLEVLCKLAVLVSKFEMLETVEFFSDTWIDNLQREGLPKLYNKNVLSLVFVFWVFDRPAEFKAMTRLAQLESTEKLEEDARDIPNLHSIIDAIKRDREFAIETAITVIHALIDRYMAGQTVCDSALDDELRYACDAMVLGCLMTSSRKIGIWPKPDAPFNNRKFKNLVKAIRNIRILDVCNKTSNRKWNSHGPSPNCHGLEDSIEASMKSIEAGLDGLKLSDYPKSREDHNSIFQTSPPPLAPTNERSERTKQDTREILQVYMKEEVLQAPKDEVKVPLFPREEFSVPSSSFSPPIKFLGLERSAKEKEPRTVIPKDLSRESSKTGVDESAQEGVKVGTRQYSQELQSMVPISPRVSITDAQNPIEEDCKAIRGESLTKSQIIAKAIVKIAEESPREEMKPARSVVSIDEILKDVSQPAKEFKPSTVEITETLSTSQTTTEAEDTWTPPKNFKMKKSKKTFSTRY